jgi:hypothetical protein
MRVALALAFVVPHLFASLARAQVPEEEARALFQQANVALETGRFAEARDLLRRSIELTPNPASAFNLAIALRGTGETIAAVATFDRLLDGEYGQLSAAQRREAERLRHETRAEIAVLHISATGADEIELRVDGQRAGTASAAEVVEHRVDPGTRVVTASAPRRETAERRVDLPRGGSLRVAFELEPTADALVGTLVVEAVHPDDVLEIVGVGRGTDVLRRELEPGSYTVIADGPAGRRESTVDLEAGTTLRVRLEPADTGLLESPIFWLSAGLLVAAALTAGILLFTTREEDPIQDPVYGLVVTLR